MTESSQQVLDTAAALIAAFGSNDVDSYFGFFADDATFIFYTLPEVLDSADAYRQQWRAWEREDGFRVLSCESKQQRVQVLGSVAVFTHQVHTHVVTSGGEEELNERETIVFWRNDAGTWLAVHEHLSPEPVTG